MIRIDRGAPPPILATIRERELARVRALRRRAEPMKLGVKYNHRDVRAALFAAQGAACCYCEITLRRKGTPIEHYRPKQRARRGRGRPSHGYWWLTWSWDNLFLACPGCNLTKGDRFPLSPSSGVLGQGATPPGPERPLLLDPAGGKDPTRKIRFIQVAGRWRPIPQGGSVRAKMTIRRIALDADDLLEHYDARVRNHIEPLLRDVQDRMKAEDPPGVRRAWKRMKAMLFSRTAPFKALSYDVLDARVPRALRAKYKIALARPALRARRAAPSLPADEASLLVQINRGLPTALRDRLGTLHEKCEDAALTPDEHAELLGLVAEVEALELERIESLSRLASLRGVSLAILMAELGIWPPDHG